MPESRADIASGSPWPKPPLAPLLTPSNVPIIFVGAGVSMGCGLPNSVALADWLRDQPFASDADLDGLDRNHKLYLQRVATRIARTNQEEMREAVAEHIKQLQEAASEDLTPLLKAIARTPAGVVLTLNYDTLIEKAAALQDREVHTLGVDQIPDLIDNHLQVPDGHLRVVHLHGSIEDWRTMVLDFDSYKGPAGDGRIRELFAALLSRYNLCAIGTSFEEKYLATVCQARRPRPSRHVIVCDVEHAEAVRQGTALLNEEEHGWLACSYPKDDYLAVSLFCERLVAEDPSITSSPEESSIGVLETDSDAVYAARRLRIRDESADEQPGSAGYGLLGSWRECDEDVLGAEPLSLVVGVPGSGKSRLLNEIAGSANGPEVPVVVRLQDVKNFLGEPAALLRSWLTKGAARAASTVAVEDAVAGRKRLWFLLDGLDEVGLGKRTAAAKAIERVSKAYWQHRFTVTSRPTAALEELTADWRIFDLVCDRAWQTRFFKVNDVDAGAFWKAVAPSESLQSLLQIPFFLRGGVDLWRAGVAFKDAMDIALKLLQLALDADEHLTDLGGAPRRWLARVALSQQLSGTTTSSDDVLERLAAAHDGLGDPQELSDLMASRALLAQSDGGWSFGHRLLGEALVGERLLSDGPTGWVDCCVPVVDGLGAVLNGWAAPVGMVAGRSLTWRKEIESRDPVFAARSTPASASRDERERAARLLWNRVLDFDIWVDDESRFAEVRVETDREVIGRLLRVGDLSSVEVEVRDALGSKSRMARGSAVVLLAAVRVSAIEEILLSVIEGDDDSVVRRVAAGAAGQIGTEALRKAVISRALTPADPFEATDMAMSALDMVAANHRVALALQLADAGNEFALNALDPDGVSGADQLRWVEGRLDHTDTPASVFAQELDEIVGAEMPIESEVMNERIGYLAARTASWGSSVLAAVADNDASARGVLRALEREDVYEWGLTTLLVAIGEPALERAGLSEAVVVVRRVAADSSERQPSRGQHPVGDRHARRLNEILRDDDEAELIEELADYPARRRLGDIELSDSDRDRLATIIANAWGARDLRESVTVAGDGATLETWAVVVLDYGPISSLDLTDEQWVQVATCRWIYSAQTDWLASQATQERLDRAAGETKFARTLTDLVRVAGDLNVDAAVQALSRIAGGNVAESDRRSVAERLVAKQRRDLLELLKAVDETWCSTLRPYLAAVGDTPSQVQLLQTLQRELEDGTAPARFTLPWIDSVQDPSTFEASRDVLLAAGNHGDDALYPIVIAPLIGAMQRADHRRAIAELDVIIETRAYPGAQFLLDDRDRLVQEFLSDAGARASVVKASSLELPLADLAAA